MSLEEVYFTRNVNIWYSPNFCQKTKVLWPCLLFIFADTYYVLQISIHILYKDIGINLMRIMSKNNNPQPLNVLIKILAFAGVIGALFDLEAEKEGQKVEPALGVNWTRLTAKALMYLVLTTGPKNSSNQSTSGMYISASGSSNFCNLFLHLYDFAVNLTKSGTYPQLRNSVILHGFCGKRHHNT